MINRLFSLKREKKNMKNAQSNLFKLLPLTNQQSKNQRLFIYYHKWSKEITLKMLESISYWHFGLKKKKNTQLSK